LYYKQLQLQRSQAAAAAAQPNLVCEVDALDSHEAPQPMVVALVHLQPTGAEAGNVATILSRSKAVLGAKYIAHLPRCEALKFAMQVSVTVLWCTYPLLDAAVVPYAQLQALAHAHLVALLSLTVAHAPAPSALMNMMSFSDTCGSSSMQSTCVTAFQCTRARHEHGTAVLLVVTGAH
jgi:hypothetical protein